MSITKTTTQHLQRYPKMQIQDLYKLLFQAAMGNEHLLRDPVLILDYLQRELTTVKPDQSAELAEPISAELVRLHLGPFKARKGQPEQVLQLMFKTAEIFTPSKERLIIYWNELIILAENKLISFTPNELRSFFDSQHQAGLPAVHHSVIFREYYQPAYRVISKKFLAELEFAE